MKGLKQQEIRNVLQATYEKNAPTNIDDYVLDEKLSNLYGKVYVNENSKKVILGFRGTGMENMGTDWINNLIFAVSDPAYKLTPRYRTALKMYQDATREKFNVFIINLDKSGNERYRRNFTDYYYTEN